MREAWLPVSFALGLVGGTAFLFEAASVGVLAAGAVAEPPSKSGALR